MIYPASNQGRTAFRTLLIVLTLLSLWRVLICLSEYDAGPFVSVSRTLLDQTPFWSLGAVIAAYSGWNRASVRSTRFLLWSTCILLVAASDLVMFNVTARERLYEGFWVGRSSVALPEDEPYLHVTFTADHAVFLLGTNRTQIYSGGWQMEFDPIR